MTIRLWTLMLAGLSIWALHFLGVYLISSVADVVATSDDFACLLYTSPSPRD